MAHVLVTGGSRGIGAALIRRLTADGDTASFIYKSRHEVAEALEAEVGSRTRAIQADITVEPDVRRAVNEAEAAFGPLDALVNCAAFTGMSSTLLDTPLGQVRDVFAVNVLGAFAVTQEVVRRWIDAQRQGVVVNVTSTAARLGGGGEFIGYAASKGAVETMTLGMGRELAPHGIRVVAIQAGTTRTGVHAEAGDPERPERIAKRVPLGRIAEPDEIAAAITFALSAEASYITAASITVAGGI